MIIKTIKRLFTKKAKPQQQQTKLIKREIKRDRPPNEREVIYLSSQRDKADNWHCLDTSIKIEEELFTPFSQSKIIENDINNYSINFCFIPPEQNSRNVRSYLEYTTGSYEEWDNLRYICFKKQNFTCESCKKQFKKKSELQLHEQWTFNNRHNEQKLQKLITLCPYCHEIAHINRFKSDTDKMSELLMKYAEYNKIDDDTAFKKLMFHEALRNGRRDLKFNLDMTLLKRYGLNTPTLFDCFESNFDNFVKTTFLDKE